MSIPTQLFTVQSLANGGDPVSAPRIYSLSTTFTAAQITTSGFLNGVANQFKAGDVAFVTHDYGTGSQAVTTYYVSQVGSNLQFAAGVPGGGGGAGAVSSVFTRTGAVVATNGDYTASQVTNVPAGGIAAVTVQNALNGLDTAKAPLASPAFTGGAQVTGNLTLAAAGNKLIITGGSNAAIGTLVLTGVTPVVVANTSVTANSIILLGVKTPGGTPAFSWVSAISAGVSFSVTGTVSDTSTLNYLIIN